MIEVPYLDLGKIHDEIREELDTAYHQVMDREWSVSYTHLRAHET